MRVRMARGDVRESNCNVSRVFTLLDVFSDRPVAGCFDDQWNTMRTCTSDLVCSVDPTKTGCIWPWQVDTPSETSSTSDQNGEQTASTTSNSFQELATGTSQDEALTSSTQTPSATAAAEQTSTLLPTNPWSTVTPTASPSLIGNALFHWQDGMLNE